MGQQKKTAVILAGGQGKRMNSKVQKQYLQIQERPLLAYALKAFQDSFIDEIILVVQAGEIDYCKREIVDRYQFTKVKKIVEGGKERYHSVYHGMMAAEDCKEIYIHDGARPFIDSGILQRARLAVEQYGACCVGMPVKDTIKISDENGFAGNTPKRSLLWAVQTPQAFRFEWIREAYEKLMIQLETGPEMEITDDAMVLELMTGKKVKLVEGSYQNIKITTPEDLKTAELFAAERNRKF